MNGYFERYIADILGQFTELALYAYRYIDICMHIKYFPYLYDHSFKNGILAADGTLWVVYY